MELQMVTIPSLLATKTFENYEPKSPQQAAARRIAQGVCEKREEVSHIKGLWMHGPYGTGKTHLLAAMYNQLKGEGMRWLHADAKGREDIILEAFLYGRLEPLQGATHIFVDEMTIVDMPKGKIDALIGFFRMVYAKGIPLFVTSNHSLSEVSDKLVTEGQFTHRSQTGEITGTDQVSDSVTGRIESRLHEILTPVEILGEDFRKILAERALEQVRSIIEDEKGKWPKE